MTFWLLTYWSSGARVIVAGEEAFTIQPGGLSAVARFSLSVDLADGLVTRLLLAWEAERASPAAPGVAQPEPQQALLPIQVGHRTDRVPHAER